MRLLTVIVVTVLLWALPAATADRVEDRADTPFEGRRAPPPCAVTVGQAVAVFTRDDHGRHYPAARWPEGPVAVHVTGPATSPTAEREVDRVLAWLTATTGTVFTRTQDPDAPLTVRLTTGVTPRAVVDTVGHDIVAAHARWDPTIPHARRWVWEELLHAAGALGDHGPPGSVLSTDQTALAPSPFDRWVLAGLYQAGRHDRENLTAALTDRCRRLLPTADPGR